MFCQLTGHTPQMRIQDTGRASIAPGSVDWRGGSGYENDCCSFASNAGGRWFFFSCAEIPPPVDSSSTARDPGVRGGAAGAGAPLAGLTKTELVFFNAGTDEFVEEEDVADGLGPTMNLGSCAGCHLQPAVGGTSPPVNPQVAFATLNGAANSVPSFITANGPVREARFVKNPDGTPDGGVHDLFTITGRSDAPGCMLL